LGGRTKKTIGGIIFIGVNDSGKIVGLTPHEVEKTNQLIANATTNNIRPSMLVPRLCLGSASLQWKTQSQFWKKC